MPDTGPAPRSPANGYVMQPQPHGGALPIALPDPYRSEKKAAFLAALVECGDPRDAARLAGIGVGTPYDWRDADPDFAAAWHRVNQALAGAITGSLYKRATDPDAGMAGNVAGFGWLKGHFPEQWSEKHLLVGGQDAALLETVRRSTAVLERLDARAAQLQAREAAGELEQGKQPHAAGSSIRQDFGDATPEPETPDVGT